MKINDLQLTSSHNRKRVGRGISAGQGKTAGRGTKGQNARTGGGVRPGFEGGQNPLSKRLPKKRGFRALSHVDYQVVNLESLQRFDAGTLVDAETLAQAGLIKQTKELVKILGRGELGIALTVKVNAASGTAKAAIVAAGGSVEIVKLPKTPKKATRPKVEEASA